jgi:hypothetical protein
VRRRVKELLHSSSEQDHLQRCIEVTMPIGGSRLPGLRWSSASVQCKHILVPTSLNSSIITPMSVLSVRHLSGWPILSFRFRIACPRCWQCLASIIANRYGSSGGVVC